MPLERLEHFLIQTTQLQATRDWYVDVLGMTEGWHPDFKFPVVWLYLGDKDVLHLTEGGPIVSQNRLRYLGQQSTQTQGTGVVDHVAFRCSDLPGMLQHIRERNVKASHLAFMWSKHLPLVIAIRNIAPGGHLGHAKNLSDP